MSEWLAQQAALRDRRGLTRTLSARAAGESVIDLASNDYLGLSMDPRMIEAAASAARTWGTGSTSSRLVAGTTALHEELERALAELVGMRSALVYSSGYLANVGVLTALGSAGTLIVADSHCHASMIDGFRLSRARTENFEHGRLADADRLLASRGEARAIIAVESIYSVLGDEAPLPDLLELALRHDAILLVDEAHSIGVSGAGRGSVAGTALAGHPNVVVTATLSKALGSQGGAVLASPEVREHLVNRSRAFIFDTGLAPTAAAAARTAIAIIGEEPWRSAALHRNADELSSGLAARLGRSVERVPGAVQSIPMPSPEVAVDCARAALDAGVRVGCFRPPSVPDGVSRLRLTARATLDDAQIGRVCAILGDIIGERC